MFVMLFASGLNKHWCRCNSKYISEKVLEYFGLISCKMMVSHISDGDEDDEAYDDDQGNDRMQTTETFLSAGTSTEV